MEAFGVVFGSAVFFGVRGFKQSAEQAERETLSGATPMSDGSTILRLEIIGTTSSIDGGPGAFAFTTSIPLVPLGDGRGAVVSRQFTIGNIGPIEQFGCFKSGAMGSVPALGGVTTPHAFGWHIPEWRFPEATTIIIDDFWRTSARAVGASAAPSG